MDLEAGLIDRLPEWPETARIVGQYGRLALVDTGPLMARLRALQTSSSPAAASALPPPSYVRAPLALARPAPTMQVPMTIGGAPVPRTDVYARSLAATTIRRADITSPIIMPRTANQHAAMPQDANRPVRAEEDDEPDSDSEAVPRDHAKIRRHRRLRRAVIPVVATMVIAGAFYLMQSAPRALYGLAGVMPAPLHAPTRGVVDFVVYQTAPVRDGLRWIDVGDPRLRKVDRKALP
jgi:hypothetical protein